MLILAIETTGPLCSVALGDENDILQKVSDEKMNHLKRVTEMVRQVAQEKGVSLSDIDVIAVSAGPGSFTGIRIGVSTARALSQALGKPVVSVPSLSAFAYREAESFSGNTIAAMFNARRNQVYAYACGNGDEIVPAAPYDLEEFLSLLVNEDDILFVGDGVEAYGEAIDKWAKDNDKEATFGFRYQDAEGVLKAVAGQPGAFKQVNDYNLILPQYMREAEAERKLRAGKLGKK